MDQADNSHHQHPPPTSEEGILTTAGKSDSSMPLHNEGLSNDNIDSSTIDEPLQHSSSLPAAADINAKPPSSMHQPLHLTSSTATTTSIIMKGDMNNNAASVSFTFFNREGSLGYYFI